MKVAIVLNTSWNIYNFRMGLIKALKENGHEIYAIAPEDEYSSKLEEAGCEYHEVTMDSRGVNPIKDLALFFELRKIYKKIRPDVVLHYTIKPNLYGTMAATTLRIPAINNVCGLGTVFLNENLVSKIALTMYKFAFRFPKKVFFQNSYDHQLFVERGLVKKGISDIVPGSGIDLKYFQPEPFKRNKRFTFLLISRLIHDKGVIEYIDAIKKLQGEGANAKFQVLGAKDPEHRRGIKSELVDSWIENNIIEYLGTTDDVRQYIADADCVVLPSYREGTPRTLLEAASSSKPIIATDVPGCKNVVKHSFNGLLCKLKDSNDLAEKMSTMMQFPDERIEELGKNGRMKVENEFSENLVINKYLKSIAELNAAKL